MDYPVAGSFMRREYRMEVDWHFSGTFFWFRNEDVFNQPHMKFSDPLNRCDVERWPARMFKFEEAHCLGMPDCRNLYDEINWRSWITRRFQKEVLWDATMRRERTKAITDWSALPETAFEPLGEIYKCMKAA
jgi:hypothetical protein